MSFYPDNVKRGERVNQLMNHMVSFQTDIKDIVAEDDKNLDSMQKTITYLEEKKYIEIDPKKGLEKMMELLPPEERKKVQDLIDEWEKEGKKINAALSIIGILGGISFIAKIITSQKALLYVNRAVLAVTDKLAAKGVAYMLEGNLDMARAFYRMASRGLQVSQEIGQAGGEAAEAAVTTSRIAKFSKIMGAITVVLTFVEIALLIYQIVEESKQRDELRNYIIEYASKRFMMKQLQLKSKEYKNFDIIIGTYISSVRNIGDTDWSEDKKKRTN